MKRFLITAVTAAAVAAPMAVPAIASANVTTNQIAQQYSQQVHNRARLSGLNVSNVNVKCASNGGGYYSCFATYVVTSGRYHAKYGIYIDANPRSWHTEGNRATLLNVW